MSMSVMRRKYLNKAKLNQNNKVNLFTLTRTNTGNNNNCNCGVKSNKTPVFHKSFYNHHNRINEPWCEGDAYYKKNFKLKLENENYIENKASCVLNDPNNMLKPDDDRFKNTMGYCKNGVVIRKPVITKDMPFYSNNTYIDIKKSKCKQLLSNKNVITYKRCTQI